jgi:Lon protease-like protein
MPVAVPPSLPLLPFNTVLVPGAALELRLVAPAHLELVRECGRRDAGFGVCLVLQGEQTDAVASTAAFGTEARIEDFSAGEDGVPALRIRGRRRFHVRQTRVRDSGLITAVVDWCEPDPDDPVRPEHAALVLVLERILQKAGVDATPTQLDDAAWVSWRLIEWLPLTDSQRQALLQEDDPHARLDRLLLMLS